MSEYTQLRELVSFRPLERPIECLHQPSRFGAPWSATVDLLARELRQHGAENAVLQIDLRESDFRIDGLPRSDRRAMSPGVILNFTARKVPGEPALRYEVGTYHDWQDNVRAIALGLEALRAVDRYGVTRRGEQYAGWKQLGAGQGVGEGDPNRGRELIRIAGGDVKQAMFLAHPDHGGQDEDFRDVMAARDAA